MSHFSLFKKLSSPRNLLFIILTLAIALRVILLVHYQMIDTDSAYYGSLARLSAKGYWPKALDPYWPPFYPFLASLPYRFGLNLEASGLVISILASAGYVFLCFFLAKLVAGDQAGLMAAWMAAIHPRFVSISQSFLTEPLYVFLASSSFVLFCYGLKNEKHQSLTKSVFLSSAVGVLCSLAFLTRHEGAFYLVLLLALSTIRFILKPSPQRGFWPIFMLAGFVAISFIYFYHLAKIEGRLSFGEKAEANFYIAYKNDYQQAGISVEFSDYESITGPEQARQPGNYRLFEFISHYPWKIIKRTFQNIPRALLDKIPSLMTWPFFILSIFGFVYRKKIRRSPFEKLYILWILLTVLIYSPLFLFRRFFISTLPILLVWCAVGFEELRMLLPRKLFSIFIVIWSVSFIGASNFSLSRQSWPILYKEAGQWLKRQNIKHLVLSGRKPEISFYAEAEFRPLKAQGMAELKDLLAKEGITHLIVEDYILPLSHPGLAGLLDARKAPPWLYPIHTATKNGHQLIIYKFSSGFFP